MCVTCLTTFEHVAAKLAVVAWVGAEPAHRVLARAGVVDAPDPVARDVRTIAFLRSLDLDPVELLGADVVTRADGRAQPVKAARRRFSASPIGSQSLPITQ